MQDPLHEMALDHMAEKLKSCNLSKLKNSLMSKNSENNAPRRSRSDTCHDNKGKRGGKERNKSPRSKSEYRRAHDAGPRSLIEAKKELYEIKTDDDAVEGDLVDRLNGLSIDHELGQTGAKRKIPRPHDSPQGKLVHPTHQGVSFLPN